MQQRSLVTSDLTEVVVKIESIICNFSHYILLKNTVLLWLKSKDKSPGLIFKACPNYFQITRIDTTDYLTL